MRNNDIFTLLTLIAGLTGTGLIDVFGTSINTIAPGWGTKAVGLLSTLSAGAGLIVYLFNNKTGAAATSISSNATIVHPVTGATVGELLPTISTSSVTALKAQGAVQPSPIDPTESPSS